MDGADKITPASPYAKPRKILLLALAVGLTASMIVAGLLALGMGVELGRDYVVGAVIALLPQLWFVHRSAGATAGQAAAVIALAKYGLSATGFALWFAAVPDANLVATLVGTATAIIVLVSAIKQLECRLNDF